MSRRSKIGIFIGVLVLLLGWFIWWLLPSGVTTANVGRLRQGMSVAEVEENFGKPPDYGDPQPNGEMRYTWVDDDDGLRVRVTFARGRLVGTEIGETNFPSFRVKIRKWLGWY